MMEKFLTTTSKKRSRSQSLNHNSNSNGNSHNNDTIPDNGNNSNNDKNNSNSNQKSQPKEPNKKKRKYNTSKPNGKAKYTPKTISKSQHLAQFKSKYKEIDESFKYLPKEDCVQCKFCGNRYWTGDTHGLSPLQIHISKETHKQNKQKSTKDKQNDIGSIITSQSQSQKNQRFEMFKPLLVMALLILVCQLPLYMIVSLMSALDFLGMKSTQSQYTSGEQRTELFHAIGDVCAQTAHDKIRMSPSIGVCIDEGTDVSEDKTLMVYCRIFNFEIGDWEEVFAGALNLNGDFSAKNIALTLIEFLLNVVRVSIEQVTGFSSDGASVMVGHIGGVWAYFKVVFIYAVQFHCICYKGDLAVGKILLAIPELIVINDLMRQIYLYFSRSKNKYLLQEQAKELNVCFESIKQSYVSVHFCCSQLMVLIVYILVVYNKHRK